MKPDSLSRNIAASKAKAKAEGREFNFNPYGDGGEQHLNNSAGIAGASIVGRVQGEDVVPHVPEDELEKMPFTDGVAVPPNGFPGPRRTNPQFTYDGRAAVSKMRGELDPYQGFDTPKERLALERKATSSSLESLHDKREAWQMWPSKRVPAETTPPVSDLQRFWRDNVPGLDNLFNASRKWLE
ncbi:hypothetical protein MKZ91_01665 [Ensifer sp. MJa1]